MTFEDLRGQQKVHESIALSRTFEDSFSPRSDFRGYSRTLVKRNFSQLLMIKRYYMIMTSYNFVRFDLPKVGNIYCCDYNIFI